METEAVAEAAAAPAAPPEEAAAGTVQLDETMGSEVPATALQPPAPAVTHAEEDGAGAAGVSASSHELDALGGGGDAGAAAAAPDAAAAAQAAVAAHPDGARLLGEEASASARLAELRAAAGVKQAQLDRATLPALKRRWEPEVRALQEAVAAEEARLKGVRAALRELLHGGAG